MPIFLYFNLADQMIYALSYPNTLSDQIFHSHSLCDQSSML